MKFFTHSIFIILLTFSSSYSQNIQQHTEHFFISHPETISHHWIEKSKQSLERAYTRVSQFFNDQLKSIVIVILYDKTWQFVQATSLPYYIGGVYDGTLQLQHPRILHHKGILNKLLTHEITHIFVNQTSDNNVPLWLNEGLAVYVAGESYPIRMNIKIRSFRHLNQLLRDRKNKRKMRYGYQLSGEIVSYLINNYGKMKLISFLKRLKSEKVEIAFESIYKQTFQLFEKRVLKLK